MAGLTELWNKVQELLDKSKDIHEFDANAGDVENLVIPAYNTSKAKVEKVAFPSSGMSEDAVNQAILDKIFIQYSWLNQTEQDAETDVQEGEVGLRTDERFFYRYNGTSWDFLFGLDKEELNPKVEVFGNQWTLIKHPTNNNPSNRATLENNDFIVNGFFNNTTLWDKAQCLDASNKDLEASWTVFSSSEDLIII